MVNDFTAMDFFRDDRLVENPYPYFDALRQQCPVTREQHYGVMMVTGWEEAVEVANNADEFSSCISVTGPFPGFPVPLEGDDVTELIQQHRDELPFSDQLPTLDPPTHTNHRALLMRLITPSASRKTRTPCGPSPIGCWTGCWRPARANSSKASPVPLRCW
jgi:cytochrome P450